MQLHFTIWCLHLALHLVSFVWEVIVYRLSIFHILKPSKYGLVMAVVKGSCVLTTFEMAVQTQIICNTDTTHLYEL